MKTFCILIAVLGLASGITAAAPILPQAHPHLTNSANHSDLPSLKSRSLDDIIYYEDWESGTLDGWVSRDLTDLPAKWHVDSTRGLNGSACWWVGDPTVGPSGGYLNHWYHGLDSPPITLGANPVLHFWQKYSCEGGQSTCYDGMDGLNLRISSNDGASWSVIEGAAVTPPYACASIYAFMFTFFEGARSPGWSDSTAGREWHEVTADLSAWAGQTVRIRWAFASDDYFCTNENSRLFGWMVDNIRLYCGSDTLLSYTDTDDAGWRPRLLSPVSGDLWHIAVDTLSPAGPHIIFCTDTTIGRCHPLMYNSIESPFIDLRSVTGTITADFLVGGGLGSGIPEDYDFWGMDVTTDSGRTWCAASNPTCDPHGNNWIYPDCPEEWSVFSVAWGDTVNLSALAGRVIKFRFYMCTDNAYETSLGPKFDGFVIKTPSTSADPEANNLLSAFALSQNYPNPFNPETRIRFDLPRSGKVTLKVYNIAGQLVTTLADGAFTAGEHEVLFDGHALASGIYFYRLQSSDVVQTKKMVVLK